MWSDRTPAKVREELARRLRGALGDGARLQNGFTWLESGPGGPCLLRNPLALISCSHGQCRITTASANLEIEAPAFQILEAACDAWRDMPGAFLAGYLSYDLAAELEDVGPLPADDLSVPQLYLGLYDSYSAELPAGNGGFRAGVISSRPSRAEFEASVARIVSTIQRGDIFQTNLCRRLDASFDPAAAWVLFLRMREINPARYSAFVRINEDRAVISSSPERFLKVTKGEVESSPIKGTRPRAADQDRDRALAEELLASEKDRAELAMIVDVVRNDLGRVCEIGSVQVTEHAQLMSLPTVHHSFSTVRGRLRRDASTVGLLRAAFPPASISGAPKIEAIRVAMREEGQLRGPAMGAIGWIALNGDCELSVAIRTAFTSKGKIHYYAGCGITADSDPTAEYEESAHKAAAFLRALSR